MCGRIEYIVTDKRQLEDHYGATLVEGYTDQGFSYPRYNIPPTAHTPVVTTENKEEILIGHWGFIPEWAKGRPGAKAVINARAESILEKPYFRSSINSRRCLIPVTGFFEWKRDGKTKTPYRFHRNGEIFSLAGVYTTMKDEDGFVLPHYAIITTRANDLMSPVHDRMPVIVEHDDETKWIDDSLAEQEISKFFKPVPPEYMVRDEISSLVNSVKNDFPEIINPV